jgi:hypothetical protein
MTMWETVDGVDDAGRDCFEDRFGHSGAMAWILDGASAVSQEKVTTAPSDALWMVKHLDAELEILAPSPDPLDDLVARAIRATAKRAAVEWNATPEVPPSAALGVVRRSGERTEFLVLADVSVILRTDAGVIEFTDQRVDENNNGARDVMAAALAPHDATFAQAYEQTRPHLAERRRSAMNRLGGYWVASTDDTAAHYALAGELKGVNEVVLASDGFMRAIRVFSLIPDLATLFAPDSDFEHLAGLIRKAERDDPQTRNFPRWSVGDDICARRLRWVGE